MGSPKTRPTVGRPWPRNAERHRQTIYELAGDGQELLEEQRDLLDRATGKLIENPSLAELLIAQAMTRAADLESILWQIQLRAEQARNGVEPSVTATP